MYGQALRLRETVLRKEHSDTLTSMANQANVLRVSSKYEHVEIPSKLKSSQERQCQGKSILIYSIHKRQLRYLPAAFLSSMLVKPGHYYRKRLKKAKN